MNSLDVAMIGGHLNEDRCDEMGACGHGGVALGASDHDIRGLTR